MKCFDCVAGTLGQNGENQCYSNSLEEDTSTGALLRKKWEISFRGLVSDHKLNGPVITKLAATIHLLK